MTGTSQPEFPETTHLGRGILIIIIIPISPTATESKPLSEGTDVPQVSPKETRGFQAKPTLVEPVASVLGLALSHPLTGAQHPDSCLLASPSLSSREAGPLGR